MTGWMSLLLLAQQPAQQAPAGGGIVGMLIFLVPMFIIMYLLMIKPQQKKQKEHLEMLKKLQVGDEVITSGGIVGTIAQVKDKSFVIKVSDTTKMEFLRSSVVGLVEQPAPADAKKDDKKK
jgi:preprotein translocase subunit YajC